ncbi:MAG: hypothetical protein JW751_05525 [Polyangiaceae bacterium]|nr:hypothetical protein [Polyangiaceae bacterium]
MILRDEVLAFTEALFADEPDGYRFWQGGKVTLLSTAFAVLTRTLLGGSTERDVERVGRGLRSRQSTTGHFVDPSFRPEDARGTHRPDYIEWQTTYYVLSALDALGERPQHALAFVEPLRAAVRLDRWLEARNWRNFWLASNEIMFLLYFLAYLERRQEDRAAAAVAHQVLDRLDSRQDPETGYFGSSHASINNQMYGAAHIYMFYDHFGRPIRYAEQILDTTLALERATGLYGHADGGACEDYDAIEILLRVSRHTSHRRFDVRQSLERTATAIRERRRPGAGGFSYRLAPPGLAAWLWRRAFGGTYRYSGWRAMTCPLYAPDTWATFFRTLAIVGIDAELGPGGPCLFPELPAWGYRARRTTK